MQAARSARSVSAVAAPQSRHPATPRVPVPCAPAALAYATAALMLCAQPCSAELNKFESGAWRDELSCGYV